MMGKLRESLIDKGGNEDKITKQQACFYRQKQRILLRLTFISTKSFGNSTYYIYLCNAIPKKG